MEKGTNFLLDYALYPTEAAANYEEMMESIKEQFPNEDALEHFVCCYYCDLNRSYSERTQRGFCQASAEILQLFEDRL